MDFVNWHKKMDWSRLDILEIIILKMDFKKGMDLFIKDNFKMEFLKVKVNYVLKIKLIMVILIMVNLQVKI